MPSNTHKSAAVPFVNQKGERSMKRVKVERYVAGQKPAYAKDDEEDEEYYTTDEEEEYEEREEEEEEEEEEEAQFHENSGSRFKSLGYSQDDDDDDDDESDASGDKKESNQTTHRTDLTSDIRKTDPTVATKAEVEEDSDSCDEDDPRFRRLKAIERSKTNAVQLIQAQQRTLQIQPKYEVKNVVMDEDDDEEAIRQRHALARQRQLEAPVRQANSIGPAALGEDSDDEDPESAEQRQAKRLDTEDLLKDLKLTGIKRNVREKLKTEEEQEGEQRRLREMIDQAKEEASKTNEIYNKVDQDIKREAERMALAKGDIGAREMSSVNTDDEDEELAYEEWKLREIKRVLRDRSERTLLTAARAR